MKNFLCFILLILLSITLSSCKSNKKQTIYEFPNSISKEQITGFSFTKKIIIKNDNTAMATIIDQSIIQDILTIISTASTDNEDFNCDGTNLYLEMYDSNDKLIDNIYVWTDGRIIPSKSSTGCAYYFVDKFSLNTIIENQTGTKFYFITDLTENCDKLLELVFEENGYKYYFPCTKSDKIFIEFITTNQKMTLKEAINNNYITPDEIIKNYPGILIKFKNTIQNNESFWKIS